jgi:transposase
MSNPRYPAEFKIEAVKQVTERGLPVAEVAARLGMSTHSLYAWAMRAGCFWRWYSTCFGGR